MMGDTDPKPDPADSRAGSDPAGSKLGDMGKGSFEQSQREARKDPEGKGEAAAEGEGRAPSPAR